ILLKLRFKMEKEAVYHHYRRTTDVSISIIREKYLQFTCVKQNSTTNLSDSNNKIDVELLIKILYQHFSQPFPTGRITVYDIDYFFNVAVLLAKCKKQTVQRLMWWKVVKYLMLLTTKQMRILRYSISKPTLNYELVPRTKECLKQIHDLMPAAVGYKIATSPKFIATKNKMEEMLSNIKASFITLVTEADWMDDVTKLRAVGKVKAMKHMIGYPEALEEPSYLVALYSEVKIENNNFLKTVINIITANTKKMLSKLNDISVKRIIEQHIPDPFLVNAFNTIHFNFIVIPSGILEVPFYGLGLEALNYGAIGFILAHELTHSFDTQGRLYDEHGKMNNWWSNNTAKQFEIRAGCFREQYSKYTVRGEKEVNGGITIGENIADNGGLREAVRAYFKYVEHNGAEKKLPGLENYTHEQLLYLAFGIVWCSSGTKEADIWGLGDVHSPSRFRVIGTLSNMKEFSEVWQCSSKSAMNPTDKCILW
ncbi:hypothetical protein L9F63_016363, partial [Diploptera punctata]